jgi:hypothetical protein
MQSCEALSPLALTDGSAYGPDLMRIIDSGYGPESDRRGKTRLGLAWTIYLLRSTDACPLESRTVNVSSKGFYCFAPEAFVVGECVRCTMMIPSFTGQRHDDYVALQCQATVLRVDVMEGARYGVACQIDDYRIVTPITRKSVAV